MVKLMVDECQKVNSLPYEEAHKMYLENVETLTV